MKDMTNSSATEENDRRLLAQTSRVEFVPYQPKRILNGHKHVDGGWLWPKYGAHPHIGCQGGCVYCYWRDEKYNMLARDPAASHLSDPFSQYIKIKTNAPDLLRKELSRVQKDVINVGDYQPAEEKYGLSREMLGVCAELAFPTLILETSPLVLKDLDVISKINERSWACVMFSIARGDSEGYGEIFEPNAPRIEGRFRAMKKIADSGILTGTAFMPILPHICDDDSNLENVVRKTAENGGRFVLAAGLTMSGAQARFFLDALRKYDAALVEKYEELYGTAYSPLDTKYSGRIGFKVRDLCARYGILDRLPVTWRHVSGNWEVSQRTIHEWLDDSALRRRVTLRRDIKWWATGYRHCKKCQRRPGVLVPIDQDGEVVWVCTKDHTHILDAASGMA